MKSSSSAIPAQSATTMLAVVRALYGADRVFTGTMEDVRAALMAGATPMMTVVVQANLSRAEQTELARWASDPAVPGNFIAFAETASRVA